MIPVVWKSYADSPARGYWDQTILEWLFAQSLPAGFRFEHHDGFVEADGLILVTPGHWRDGTAITEQIAHYRWVLLIVTSDEEGACPYWQVTHPNMLIWRTFPRPQYSHQPDRYMPLGWTPHCHPDGTSPDKTVPWLFAGQVTHQRRRDLVTQLRRLNGGVLYETPGFTQGWEPDEYMRQMAEARIVLCPSGPNHPDTFRMYETLETGGVPVADMVAPSGVRDPWGRTFHTRPPFPIMDEWHTINRTINQLNAEWPAIQHRVFSWWQQTKRQLIHQLHTDLSTLTGGEPARPIYADERITALISTSPISRHPDLSMILTTIETVRQQLPSAEILVMVDGIRPEQRHYQTRYDQYKTDLLWELNRYSNITPYVFDEWQHQANMTRRVLQEVTTNLILFVEHDTPLVGDIPWKKIGHQILSDRYHLVRFHYDTSIHPEHRYLMEDLETVDGIQYLLTRQWSQRPHLARTDQYRQWIDRIATTSRTMIEDALHGPCANSEWENWRLAIYHPSGNIQRSTNLDGRGDDPKYEMIYQ